MQCTMHVQVHIVHLDLILYCVFWMTITILVMTVLLSWESTIKKLNEIFKNFTVVGEHCKTLILFKQNPILYSFHHSLRNLFGKLPPFPWNLLHRKSHIFLHSFILFHLKLARLIVMRSNQVDVENVTG